MDNNVYKARHYVYTLSYDNIVFYVGSTHKPYDRFRQHCSLNEAGTCHLIYFILMKKELSSFDIIHICEGRFNAQRFEYNIIRNYASIKHRLLNVDNNDIDNILTVGYAPIWECKKERHKSNYAIHVNELIISKDNEYEKTK